MSRLSDTLQRTLDEIPSSAAALERRAELPAMSIKNIFNGSHPRSDRFDQLLKAIPGLTHRTELLIAYILDDCPDTYTAATEAILRDHLYSWLQSRQSSPDTASIVQEITLLARPLSTATLARQVLTAMAQRLDEGDTLLAEWLADTGQLLTSAHLPATDPAPETPAKYTTGGGSSAGHDTIRHDAMPTQHAAQEHQES